MSQPSAPSADALGREAFYHLRAYIAQVQDEACDLDALIEAVAILKDHEGGSNAMAAVLTIVQAKALAIFNALDSVNLPQPETLLA